MLLFRKILHLEHEIAASAMRKGLLLSCSNVILLNTPPVLRTDTNRSTSPELLPRNVPLVASLDREATQSQTSTLVKKKN